MLIIFLDVDGVLNTWDDEVEIEPACMAQLKRILQETDAEIVLSSSWRGTDGPEVSISGLQEHRLAKYFAKHEVPLWVDRIPRHYIPFSVERPFNIMTWLSQHSMVSNFIALDDEDNIELYPHNFKTQPKKGITPEVADKAISFLNRPYKLTQLTLQKQNEGWHNTGVPPFILINGEKYRVAEKFD